MISVFYRSHLFYVIDRSGNHEDIDTVFETALYLALKKRVIDGSESIFWTQKS